MSRQFLKGLILSALDTAEGLIRAKIAKKGKVRELYDLEDCYLIVSTDRISALDYILKPGIPGKGFVLNNLSKFWFKKTEQVIKNHLMVQDSAKLKEVLADTHLFKDFQTRTLFAKKAIRIPIECVARGYLAGNGWRQYTKKGEINGFKLPKGLRKNQRFSSPIFTPAIKKDQGPDEDISFSNLVSMVGKRLADALQQKCLELYRLGERFCEGKGIILADAKFEFGIFNRELILIDEILTPDSSRFWPVEKYSLDIEMDSLDKEPIRSFLASSLQDNNNKLLPIPKPIVDDISKRYQEIYHRITGNDDES